MLPLTKRQREILDYLQDFIQQHGYAPSLEEIGRRFGLSSLATVHKHLTNLQEKGFIKRAWNRSRSVEMIPTNSAGRAVDLPRRRVSSVEDRASRFSWLGSGQAPAGPQRRREGRAPARWRRSACLRGDRRLRV